MKTFGNEFLDLKFKKIRILKQKENTQVYLAEMKDNQQKIIIKEIKLINLEEKIKNMIVEEISILLKIKNPNLIDNYEFHFDNEKLFILKEYADGGNLYNKIQEQKTKNEFFEEKIIIQWLFQLCEGMVFIKENNIFQDELKLNNIFIKFLLAVNFLFVLFAFLENTLDNKRLALDLSSFWFKILSVFIEGKTELFKLAF